MQYIHRKLLSFACVALFGCAVGVAGDDPLAELAPETANHVALDGDGGSPLIQTAPSSSTPNADVYTTPAAVSQTPTAPSSVTPTPIASTLDAAVPSALDSGVMTQDARAPVSSSSSSDAGSASKDASSTPVSAPMCNPFKCNNNCALLPRCCNENNECACLAPFGSCSLPSL